MISQTIHEKLISKLKLLKVGDTAPDFKLPDQENKFHSLSENAGHWVVLYFYPADDTPGCTKEACSFRDSFSSFKKEDIRVFGISKDAVTSHAKFAKKFSLPFPLLADPEKTVLNSYGVWGERYFMGRYFQGTHRITYLIDPKGQVAKVYTEVNTETHAQEILKYIIHN